MFVFCLVAQPLVNVEERGTATSTSGCSIFWPVCLERVLMKYSCRDHRNCLSWELFQTTMCITHSCSQKVRGLEISIKNKKLYIPPGFSQM